MLLSGKEIERRLGKDIFIEPFDQSKLNPNSYNLRLGSKLLVYEDDILDMKKPPTVREILIPEEGLVLQPGRLYLGQTMERTKTVNGLVPMLEGRSSIGRLGLYIHVTAGFGDVGFDGFWTLELSCIQPIRIYAGVDIGQIYYHTLLGDYVEYGKNGKYFANQGVQPSMLYQDFKSESKRNVDDLYPREDEVKLTVLAYVKESELDEVKHLEHHAEGISIQYPFLDGLSVTTEQTGYCTKDKETGFMHEVKIQILAFINDGDFLQAKRLEHHAEGLWEEYPFLRHVSVTVEKI